MNDAIVYFTGTLQTSAEKFWLLMNKFSQIQQQKITARKCNDLGWNQLQTASLKCISVNNFDNKYHRMLIKPSLLKNGSNEIYPTISRLMIGPIRVRIRNRPCRD